MKLHLNGTEQYDAWLGSDPDFSIITDFVAINLPGVTALPEMPAVKRFRADHRLMALRRKARDE